MLTMHKPDVDRAVGIRSILQFPRFAAGALATAVLVLAACGGDGPNLRDERDETAFRRGESLLREGRRAEALNAFVRVTEIRQEAPESHLNAGRLYLDHIRDPVYAIYHFRRFLALAPDSDRSEHVRQLIETAQKQFLRQLPGQPGENHVDRVDLMVRLEHAQEENLELKRRLALANREIADLRRDLERGAPATGAAVARAAERPAGGAATAESATRTVDPRRTADPENRVARTYSVQPGDTLTRISRELYGTPSRWEEIFEANRDRLAGPHALRVGQELQIP